MERKSVMKFSWIANGFTWRLSNKTELIGKGISMEGERMRTIEVRDVPHGTKVFEVQQLLNTVPLAGKMAWNRVSFDDLLPEG